MPADDNILNDAEYNGATALSKQPASVGNILNDQKHNGHAQPQLDRGRHVANKEAVSKPNPKPKPVVLTFDAHDDSSYAQRAKISQPTRGDGVNIYAETNPSGTVPDRVLRSDGQGFVSVVQGGHVALDTE